MAEILLSMLGSVFIDILIFIMFTCTITVHTVLAPTAAAPTAAKLLTFSPLSSDCPVLLIIQIMAGQALHGWNIGIIPGYHR